MSRSPSNYLLHSLRSRLRFAVAAIHRIPNHNNVESGVTFDLCGLNTLQQSAQRQDVVEVGAGCDWDAVYELLEKSG